MNVRFPSETMTLLRAAIPRRAHRVFVFLVFWFVVALLSSVHWELFYFGRNPYTWWELFRVKVALWYVWGAITPIILWFGWRFRLERGRWPLRLLLLAGMSVGVTVVYMALYSFLVWLNSLGVSSLSFPSIGPLVKWVVGVHSSWYFLAFWATIGIENAIIYYQRSHEREMVASQLQRQLVEAQLEAVRSRLQPHFLFNTLHSIHALIEQQDYETASRMLRALSDLLRRALDHVEREQVSMREEIEFLRRYLDIEMVRFSDRLTVTWRIDKDAEQACVPSFLLQPLVENAIRHGIERRPGPGHIDILAHRADDQLVVEIRDNGAGLEDGGQSLVERHGLGDLRALLDRLYPGRYSLSLTSANGAGAAVSVRLPIVEPRARVTE